MVSAKRLALILILLGGILFAEEVVDGIADIDANIAETDSLAGYVDNYVEGDSPLIPTDPINKEEILAWIDLDRNFRPFEAMPISYNLQNRFLWLYQMGTNTTGRNQTQTPILLSGFRVPASLFSQATFLGYLDQYFLLDCSPSGINATHSKYSLPITLSSIKGSLGDYDNRFAKANLAKGELFGVQNLNIELGMNLINGNWLDMPTSQNSHRGYLSYRYKNTEFSYLNASFQKDISMYELLPLYWQSANYRFKHKYSLQMLSIENPVLELSLLQSNEQANGTTFTKELKLESLQFAVQRKFHWHYLDANLRYEYADVERNFMSSISYNQENYNNLMNLSLSSSEFIAQKLDANIMDWDKGNLRYSVNKHINQFSVGAYSFSFWGNHEPTLIVSSPTSFLPMAAVDIFEERNYGLSLGYDLFGVQLQSFWGQKSIIQETPLKQVDKKLNTIGINTNWNPTIQNWELLLQSAWEYQSYNELLMENPEFTYHFGAGLIRHLPYDNAISAGFTVQGHSAYYLANEANPALIDGSTMLDIYSGLKIGRLFDFRVSAKNVLDSSIFGGYPIPPSIHAGIRWYFIN